MELLKSYEGEIIFIPGNRDWANGRQKGLENVKNQRKYIENYLDESKVFLPRKGRPGPTEIHLTNDIVVIVIDSHWWFHENEKSYAGIIDEADFFVQIEDAISRNRDKKVIFAAHNPLYSVGNHGGHFAAADNLFPLVHLNKALYIPLPGFLYTGFRKFLGSNQDLSHPQYKLFIEALLETPRMRQDRQPPARLSLSNFRDSYWTVAQMVAHHTVNGCNLRPGDFFGSGTQSGPNPGEAGALIELTQGGKRPVTLNNGETRVFLEDGDAVILRGWCEKPGAARIGFGEVMGRVLPARSL